MAGSGGKCDGLRMFLFVFKSFRFGVLGSCDMFRRLFVFGFWVLRVRVLRSSCPRLTVFVFVFQGFRFVFWGRFLPSGFIPEVSSGWLDIDSFPGV